MRTRATNTGQLPQVRTQIPQEATVEGRITRLLDTDSPYMQQATTRGNQEANARGLFSSSMAAGAVEGARINAALPMASQDAGLFGQAALQDSGYRQTGALNEQQGRIQTGLIRTQGDVNRTLAADQNRYTLGQQNNQGRIQGGLIRTQGDVNRTLAADQNRYTLGQQSNQGRIQGGLIRTQGQVNSQLSTQDYRQQTNMQTRDIIANSSNQLSATIANTQANPNLSGAQQAQIIRDAQGLYQSTMTVATRGTALAQSSFSFPSRPTASATQAPAAPEPAATSSSAARSDMTNPRKRPTRSPPNGTRWGFTRGRWRAIPYG